MQWDGGWMEWGGWTGLNGMGWMDWGEWNGLGDLGWVECGVWNGVDALGCSGLEWVDVYI